MLFGSVVEIQSGNEFDLKLENIGDTISSSMVEIMF